MTVLTTILNGSSGKDVRDTLNQLLSTVATLVGSGITAPSAPTLVATPGNAQVSLTWTDGATGGATITAHKLYAGASAGSLTLIGTITSASPYIDTGLTNGTARYYALTAVNSAGESSRSAVVSATPVAAASPAAFTVTQMLKGNGQPARSNDVFQRSTLSGGGQGKGTGTVPHAISVTTPGSIYARRRSASDGATIVQAPWLVGSVTSGAQTFNVTGVDVPAIGSNASTPTVSGDGTFYLDLSGDGTTWTNGTVPIHMGDNAIWWGQSLVWYGLTRGDAVNIPGTISPYGRVFAQYQGYTPAISATAWELPSDTGNYKGSMVAEYLRCMVSATGCAQGVVGHAIGATTISVWQSGTTNMNQLVSILAAAGGSFRWEYNMIGHTDANLASGDSYFQGALTNAWGAVRAANSYPTPTRTVASIPAVASLTTTGDWVMVNTMRQAAKSWAASNASAYMQPVGLKTFDGTHQTNGAGGGDYLARELFRSYRSALGLTGGNAGPAVSSVSRSGAVITIALASAPAAITGTPHKRFRVFDAGNLNAPRAIISSAVSGSNITLTLKEDPGPGAVLDLYPYTDGRVLIEGAYDLGPETFFDTNIQADETALGFTKGRQIDFGTIGPVTVPAVTVGGTVNAIAPYNLTIVSPTYQAGASGFGNELVSGNNSATVIGMVVAQPPTFTFEAWLTCPAAPASNVAVACPPDRQLFFGFNASGQLLLGLTVASAVNYAGMGRIFVRFVQNADTKTRKVFVATAPGATPTQVYTTTINAAYRFEYGIGIHCISDAGSANTANLPVDGVALWAAEVLTAAPTAPYVGNETGLLALYNFENNGNDSCTN